MLRRDEVGGLALLEHAKLSAHVQADDELAVPDAAESLHRRDKTGEPSRHSHLRFASCIVGHVAACVFNSLFLVQLVFLLFLFSFLSLSLVSCAMLPVLFCEIFHYFSSQCSVLSFLSTLGCPTVNIFLPASTYQYRYSPERRNSPTHAKEWAEVAESHAKVMRNKLHGITLRLHHRCPQTEMIRERLSLKVLTPRKKENAQNTTETTRKSCGRRLGKQQHKSRTMGGGGPGTRFD